MLHLRKPSAALTVSPSALVLLAAFLLLSRGLTLPAALLSAALCHELAHVLTLHALHTPPRRLTLSATGTYSSTGAGLFLLPGVLWLAVKGVLPNGAKPDKMNCYKK